MMNLTYPLILASKSPRRQELLKAAGFEFEIRTKDVDESFPSGLPTNEVATHIAEKKADAFKQELVDEIIITADTVVIKDETILGKPQDHQDAFDMLRMLSGSKHLVITGVCLQSKDKKVVFDDITAVRFKDLTVDEINFYIEQFQPFDKAGAYGIQEWIGMIGITEITGSYFNVVGLPIQKLYARLEAF